MVLRLRAQLTTFRFVVAAVIKTLVPSPRDAGEFQVT